MIAVYVHAELGEEGRINKEAPHCESWGLTQGEKLLGTMGRPVSKDGVFVLQPVERATDGSIDQWLREPAKGAVHRESRAGAGETSFVQSEARGQSEQGLFAHGRFSKSWNDRLMVFLLAVVGDSVSRP